MPWNTDDVDRFNKGLSDKQKRQWVAVANSALARCLKDGGDADECEAAAIRQASGVVAKEQEPGGPEMCVCPDCGYEQEKERGVPCRSVECPDCGAMLAAGVEDGDDEEAESMPDENNVSQVTEQASPSDLANLRELLAQALALVDARLAEQETAASEAAEAEPVEAEAEFAESASGHAIELAEAQLPQDGNRAPVEFNMKIIAPGAGNRRDNHWYPADMLRRDAHVFEGVDVFVTDHRENERSERTKVGKIKSIIGFTEDGGPIGRTIIYDPDLAEKTRNRATAGELSTLHCSILAHGTAKKGEVEGKKYHIVEAISRADAVDLVSRAGAGGQALSLAESHTGGESMTEEQTEVIEEQEPVEETEPVTEPLEEVTLQEQQEPEAPPALATLDPEQVQELVGASHLPDAAKAKLSEAEYADEAEVQAAIEAEIAYIKRVTGSGKPFAQGAGSAPERKPRSAEEADADWNRILTEVGMPYLAGG